MDIFAPSYYNDFHCIADKCRHSCCIGWQIDLDADTLKKYNSLEDKKRSELLSHLECEGGKFHIRLGKGGRCPFLDAQGLCKIIGSLGDSYVSEICREHPRFYSRVKRGLEVGLGLVCEEACRIVLTSDGFDKFVKVGEADSDMPEPEFDSAFHRDRILSLLADKTLTYDEKLHRISENYAVSADIKPISEWLEIINGLDFLYDSNRKVFLNLREGRAPESEYSLRFLAYLVTRHVTVSESYDGLRARLGFCLLFARLMECAASKALNVSDIFEFARIFSEEIEYSEDNSAALIFEFECAL